MKKIVTSSGAKGHQRSDIEDRSLEFRKWHRNLDKKLYASDVDLVEFRFINGQLTAVGILEITRVDIKKLVNKEYLCSIVSRYGERDMQRQTACYIAEKLGVKAWIVLYREGLSEFWIYCLSNENSRWYHFRPEKFEEWLKNLQRGLGNSEICVKTAT